MIDLDKVVYFLNLNARGTDYSFSFDEKLKPVMFNLDFNIHLKHENRDILYEGQFAKDFWDLLDEYDLPTGHYTLHQILIEVGDVDLSPVDNQTYQINFHRVCYTCD